MSKTIKGPVCRMYGAEIRNIVTQVCFSWYIISKNKDPVYFFLFVNVELSFLLYLQNDPNRTENKTLKEKKNKK